MVRNIEIKLCAASLFDHIHFIAYCLLSVGHSIVTKKCFVIIDNNIFIMPFRKALFSYKTTVFYVFIIILSAFKT